MVKFEMMRLLRTLAVSAIIIGALLAVFALYSQPALVVALADQIWACFH